MAMRRRPARRLRAELLARGTSEFTDEKYSMAAAVWGMRVTVRHMRVLRKTVEAEMWEGSWSKTRWWFTHRMLIWRKEMRKEKHWTRSLL
jgi:hypothetical protein